MGERARMDEWTGPNVTTTPSAHYEKPARLGVPLVGIRFSTDDVFLLVLDVAVSLSSI